MQWQQRYPQHDGVYWFWGGRTGHPSAAPRIVEVWWDVWYVIGEGTRHSQDEFPGYCAGPLLPPTPRQETPPEEGNPWTLEERGA